MRKLLSANFSRLWKSKELWICAVAELIISVVTILNSVNDIHRAAVPRPIDGAYFHFAPVIGGFMAIFISLFISKEHSDCTLRNKLIVGHSRTNIFLAYFVVCFVGSLIIATAWLIGGIPGLFLIGSFEMGFSGFAVYCLIIIGMTAAFTAIFVSASAVSTNKALTVAYIMILLAVMAFAAYIVTERLYAEEFFHNFAEINGNTVIVDGEPNPNYVGGTARIVLKWIRDLIPMSQAIAMWNYDEIENPVRMITASMITTFVTNALGVLSFRKKDIK